MMRWKRICFFITLPIIAVLNWLLVLYFSDNLGWMLPAQKLLAWVISFLIICLLLLIPLLMNINNRFKSKENRSGLPAETAVLIENKNQLKKWPLFIALKSQLKRKHGVFWRRKQCWLLVLGTEPQAEHLAPGLTSEGWQESHEAVLLWGGGRDGRFG